MAIGLFAQSDGGSDRWFSLVPAGRPNPPLWPGSGSWFRGGRRNAVARNPPVQEDGKELCRPDLISVIPGFNVRYHHLRREPFEVLFGWSPVVRSRAQC